MRDSFIFYRSFFEATKTLEPKQAADLYYSICSYALDGKELELDNIGTALFSLIKPQLDANIKKWQNGQKGAKFGKLGGRPKTAKKPQKNPSKTANVNDNDNNNVNYNNNKEIYRQFNHLKITLSDYNKLVDSYGIEKVVYILDQIENYKGNTKYKSLYLTAKNWLKNDKKQEHEKKRASDFDKERTFGISL